MAKKKVAKKAAKKTKKKATLKRKKTAKRNPALKKALLAPQKLTAPNLRAMEAVTERIQGLQKEDKAIRNMVGEQFGTSIPVAFFPGNDNIIIDPSNVGTGIIDRMIKTDDTISSAVQFKIMMILSKIGEYQHSNDEIKKFVQKYLKNMRGPNWSVAMQGMLSYHGYKFSVSEVNFGLDDDLRKTPVQIKSYHPSTIAFEVDENGEITDHGIIQFTHQHTQFSNPNWRFTAIRHGFTVKNPFTTPVDRLHPHRVPFFQNIGMVRIPRNKVVHMTGLNFNTFGNPYGNSAVRTAHMLWQIKVFMLKQMGITGKRHATSRIWATAPHGAQKVEVVLGNGMTKQVSPAEAVRLMLKDAETNDNLVTGPEDDGYKMTVLADTAGLDQFVNVINALNVWIFRCFLMPSLVMTDGTAGSRSLGDKHFQIVDRIAEADAAEFTEGIINQFIERNIIENFGIQDDYGSFAQRPQTIEERQRLGSMFGQLANDGWLDPSGKKDVEFVRENLHLPKADLSAFRIGDPLNDLPEPGEALPTDSGKGSKAEGNDKADDDGNPDGGPEAGGDGSAEGDAEPDGN